MSGVAKIHRISGVAQPKDTTLLAAFFVALVVQKILPTIVGGHFRYLFSLKSMLFTGIFAISVTCAVFLSKSSTSNWMLAAVAGALYAGLFLIARIVLLGWRIEGALWGSISHFVTLTVIVGVFLSVLSMDFAPLWALVIIGWVAGYFAGSIASAITFAIVEETSVRGFGVIGFLKHSLWRVALGGVAFAGVLFAAHSAKKSPLAKF